MKIVIDIPEEAYKLLNNEGVDWLGAEHILNAVANGTPLPKSHGRSIDEQVMIDPAESEEERRNTILNTAKKEIKYDKRRIEEDVKVYDLATKVSGQEPCTVTEKDKFPKWIPVKERLPETSGDFLVSVVNNKYCVVVVMEAYFAHKDECDDLEESEWREFGPNETVIAWMPEPEPYKEEE